MAPSLWRRLTDAITQPPDDDPIDAADERAAPTARLLPLDEARPPRTRTRPRPLDCAAPRDLVSRRYRLDELLTRRGTTLTWLATDSLLGRTVLVHLIDHDEPAALEILDEARRAAPTTDGRFLRVLDADLADGERYAGYIVCEYAPGQSLELALEQGPFAHRQACRIVREVADALATMHRQGLSHRRIDPDTVVLTTSGSVKIVGFLIEAALAGRPAAQSPGDRQDVAALGDLLYAVLTARWPHGDAHGLPAAPTDRRGRPKAPAVVQRGVPDEVSRFTMRLLDPQAEPTSAAEVAATLDALARDRAGAYDPRPPAALPPSRPDRRRTLPRPEPDASGAAASPAASGGVPATETTAQLEATGLLLDPFDDEETGRLPDADEHTPFTPVPPPARPDPDGVQLADGPEPRHLWLRGLVVLFVLALVAALVGIFVNQAVRRPQPAAPTAVPVVSVRDFDPAADGGDASENGAQARLAVDGSAATAWTSERYGRSAAFNGRKPGVGLLLDLGSVQQVSAATITLTGATDLQLRVPVAEAASPPMERAAQWRTVATAAGASGSATLTPTTPVRTRYLLVYVTKLPKAGQVFQASIAEIALKP